MASLLEHAFEIGRLRREECEVLQEKGVRNFQSLVQKKRLLQNTTGIRGVNQWALSSLSDIVNWYEEFKKAEPAKAATENLVIQHLTEAAIAEFKRNGGSLNPIYDDSLMTIYRVADVSEQSQKALAEKGIKSFKDLMARKDSIERMDFIPSVTESCHETLAKVIGWAEDYTKHSGHLPSPRTSFTHQNFSEYLDRCSWRYALTSQVMYPLAKQDLEKKNSGPSLVLESLIKAQPNSTEDEHQMLYRKLYLWAARKVETELLTDKVKRAFGETRKLDWMKTFLFDTMRMLFNLPLRSPFGKITIVGGKTQSGKSAVKSLVLAVCYELRIPSVVITRGVTESKALTNKLADFAIEEQKQLIMCSTGQPGQRWASRLEDVRYKLDRGGALIVADTAVQLRRAIDAVEGKKFVLIVDECDSIYRTEEKSQKMEIEFCALRSMGPAATFMFSATPVPAFIVLSEEEGQEFDFKFLDPDADYVGVEQMRALKTDSGSPLFLKQNSLTYNGSFQYEGKTFRIPFADEACMALYHDAVSASTNNTGALLLDCTNPRVYAQGNIFDKAHKVQKYFHQSEHKQVCIVACVGKGLRYRLSYESDWVLCDKGTQFWEVADEIDKHENGEGQKCSIFVFGFTLMTRCISYRSSTRVPTHLIVHRGRGHSIESLVQTIGRGTFNGRSILQANGIEHVKILATENDFKMVKAYYKYVEEVHKQMASGQGSRDAWLGANSKHPDFANYLKYTTRRTGQRKRGSLDKYHKPSFDKAAEELSERTKLFVQKMRDDLVLLNVTRTVNDLWFLNASEFSRTDVVEAYNDVYTDDAGDSLPKETARAHMQTLLSEEIICLHDAETNRHSFFKPVNEGLLELLVRKALKQDGDEESSSFYGQPMDAVPFPDAPPVSLNTMGTSVVNLEQEVPVKTCPKKRSRPASKLSEEEKLARKQKKERKHFQKRCVAVLKKFRAKDVNGVFEEKFPYDFRTIEINVPTCGNISIFKQELKLVFTRSLEVDVNDSVRALAQDFLDSFDDMVSEALGQL